MAGTVVKSLSDDFLYCSICMEQFTTPKMLPCIHSFCQDCLGKYVSTQKGHEIACPTCRKSFHLPEAGVKDLQTNFHLVNLAEKITLLEKLASPKDTMKKCDSCCGQAVAAFCLDCNFALCPKCQRNHATFPVLRSHTVVSSDNITESEFHTEWQKVTAPFCKSHPSEKLNFYCTTCSQLICRDCTIVLHSKPDHECADASTQVSSVRVALENMLHKSRETFNKGMGFIQRGKKGSKALEKTSENLETEITQHHQKVISKIEKVLQERKASLIKEIFDVKNIKIHNIETQLEGSEAWAESMENTQKLTEKLLQENNPWELLGMSTNITNAFKALQTEVEEFQWCESQLQLGMAFKPEEVPQIELGSSEYVFEAVVSDQRGNFILCRFDHPGNAINMMIFTKDSNYSKTEEFPPHKWQHGMINNAMLKVTAQREGFIYVGYGQVVATFKCDSKECCNETNIYEISPKERYITSIEYCPNDQKVYIYDNAQNFERRNVNLEAAEALGIIAPSPVKAVFPSQNDFMLATNQGELVRCCRTAKSLLYTLQVESPQELENVGEIMFLKVIQNGSFRDPDKNNRQTDRLICFLVWENIKRDPESNVEYSTWILKEYCTRDKKFLGVLESTKGKDVTTPAALFCKILGNSEMEIHLCSHTGEVRSYKRGTAQQEPVSYEEIS